GGDEGLQPLIQRTVADHDRLDADRVRGLGLLRELLEPGAQAARRADGPVASEEPIAELALLAAGEPDDLGRVIRPALDERQRLEHRIVKMRAHLGALLAADALH